MEERPGVSTFFDAVVAEAERKFKNGTFSPVIFVMSTDGVVEIPMVNRDMVRVVVKKVLEHVKGYAVVTVINGWMAKVPIEEAKELEKIKPSEHKSAKEIMIVTLESKYLKRNVLWEVEEGELKNRQELPSMNMSTMAVGGYFDDPGAQA